MRIFDYKISAPNSQIVQGSTAHHPQAERSPLSPSTPSYLHCSLELLQQSRDSLTLHSESKSVFTMTLKGLSNMALCYLSNVSSYFLPLAYTAYISVASLLLIKHTRHPLVIGCLHWISPLLVLFFSLILYGLLTSLNLYSNTTFSIIPTLTLPCLPSYELLLLLTVIYFLFYNIIF